MSYSEIGESIRNALDSNMATISQIQEEARIGRDKIKVIRKDNRHLEALQKRAQANLTAIQEVNRRLAEKTTGGKEDGPAK